jgi:stress response protein SCP2
VSDLFICVHDDSTKGERLVAINLKKGQSINLDKKEHDLSSITIGLGWKIKSKPGFFSKLFGGGQEYDLDAIAFLLDEHDKIRELGNQKLVGSDVVFFNNLRHPSGCVVHTGDNLVGGAGVEDDEQIIVKLESLPPRYHRILFLTSIYQGNQKKQTFGEVDGAFMRAVDNRGKEIVRYKLAEDAAFGGMCTVMFGEVCRQGDGWKFRAIGDAYPTDSFGTLLKDYMD